MSEYKTTIGIECHVQLNTATKLFSAVDNDAVDKEPNSCVSPIDYALPGMLPVLNKAAIEKCVRAGLAMNCKINLTSRFDRKHYYYPDLPKGYQITQMYQPIIGAGVIHLPDGSDVHIEHAHLEEDAGKLTHFGTYSLVDLNRAGTPLIEIVSMPDIHSAAQARAYCEELHRLMMYAGVTNGDLYQGNMRFDINVSVSKTEELGTRTETKNLNSFRSIERAVEYEAKRQIEILESGGKVKQETRGWSDATGKTTSQRSKEEAQDYRYMPEPDVPPVVLEQSYVDKVAASMPMMPDEYRSKFGLLNLDHSESEAILNYPILAKRLNEVCDRNIKLAPRVAHWFSGVLLSEENQDKNFALATAEELTELSEMVEKKELSSTGAKAVLMEMYDKKNTAKTAHALAKEMNLLQENDEGALEAIINEVLTAPECAKAADDVRNGEMKAIGFLVGQVMKKSKGKANPATVNELIKRSYSKKKEVYNMSYKMPTKAVITDAGFASRFLPITKTIPKAMIPLGAKPIMQYVVEECVAAGIKDIIIVATHEGKPIYEDYFNNPCEKVYKQLESQGKLDRFEAVKEVLDMADITIIEQDPSYPYGNGSPIASAKPYLNDDEAFIALYSDDLIFGKGDVATLVEAYEKHPEAKAIIAAQEMPQEVWNKYGMIAMKDKKKQTLSHIVEKPATPEESPSNLTSYGRYLLTPEVFGHLIPKNTGLDNELWTVDAITKLAKAGDVFVVKSKGKWLTTGDPKNYYQAYEEFNKMEK